MQKTKGLNVLKICLISFLILMILSTIFISFAWFTDKQKLTSSEYSFGEIKLNVVDKNATQSSAKLQFSTARKVNNDRTWTGKYMPGDTVSFSIDISLSKTSEPAYYMVFVTDENNLFETAAYFSENGTDVFKSDGLKVVKQNDGSEVSDKIVGKITNEDTHNLTIEAKISEDLEEEGGQTTVKCTVCAIQQANLNEENANIKLNLMGSENLIPYPYNGIASGETKTYLGITIKDNGDGSVVLNGTMTNHGALNFYFDEKTGTPVNGKYILTGFYSGQKTSQALFYYQTYINKEFQATLDKDSMITYDWTNTTETKTLTRVVMFLKIGAEFNNASFKPVLVKKY